MRLIIILTLVALFFSTGAYSAEPSFTDKEAKAFIEKLWSNFREIIKLGSMTVVADESLGGLGMSYPENKMTQNFYKIYQAYEKLGIIKISIVKRYDPGKGGWGDWIAYTTGGLRQKIFIEKTDLGEALAKRGGFPQTFGEDKDVDVLVIRQYISVKVDEIVKNEARQKGIDNYRIIMATLNTEWTPEYKRVVEMIGRKLSEKRKVIMLIKFDPFSSTWKMVTFDVANRDEDFTTNHVSSALGEQK